jgi:hypothetical protein
MSSLHDDLQCRVATLEHRLARTRRFAGLATLVIAGAVASGFVRPVPVSDEVRTRRVVVVDAAGRPRIELGEDRSDFRVSRSAGLRLYDTVGAERGGFSTTANGRVTLGLDAPMGVGSPMRDRIGLVVERDGSSYVMLIDNETRAVAKLHSDGKGGGGVQTFKWERADRLVRIRTTTYDGERRDSLRLGGEDDGR